VGGKPQGKAREMSVDHPDTMTGKPELNHNVSLRYLATKQHPVSFASPSERGGLLEERNNKKLPSRENF
jgi:hypothetical protein